MNTADINPTAAQARQGLLKTLIRTKEEQPISMKHVNSTFFPDIILSHWCDITGIEFRLEQTKGLQPTEETIFFVFSFKEEVPTQSDIDPTEL